MCDSSIYVCMCVRIPFAHFSSVISPCFAQCEKLCRSHFPANASHNMDSDGTWDLPNASLFRFFPLFRAKAVMDTSGGGGGKQRHDLHITVWWWYIICWKWISLSASLCRIVTLTGIRNYTVFMRCTLTLPIYYISIHAWGYRQDIVLEVYVKYFLQGITNFQSGVSHLFLKIIESFQNYFVDIFGAFSLKLMQKTLMLTHTVNTEAASSCCCDISMNLLGYILNS